MSNETVCEVCGRPLDSTPGNTSDVVCWRECLPPKDGDYWNERDARECYRLGYTRELAAREAATRGVDRWRAHFGEWAARWAKVNLALHGELTKAIGAEAADAVARAIDLSAPIPPQPVEVAEALSLKAALDAAVAAREAAEARWTQAVEIGCATQQAREATEKENTRLVAAVRACIDMDDSPVWTITEDGGAVSYFCVECNRNERTGEHEAGCCTGTLLALLDPAPTSDKNALRKPEPTP